MNKERDELSLRHVMFGLMALMGPFVIITIYLGLSRWPSRWFTAASDIAAFMLAISIGVLGVTKLPLPVFARVGLLCLVYIPLLIYSLVIYSLYFVGYMFGDWL